MTQDRVFQEHSTIKPWRTIAVTALPDPTQKLLLTSFLQITCTICITLHWRKPFEISPPAIKGC